MKKLLVRIEALRAQYQYQWQLAWGVFISTLSGLLASQLFHNLLWLNAVEISRACGAGSWSCIVVLLEAGAIIWLLAKISWWLAGKIVQIAGLIKEGFLRGYYRDRHRL